MYYCKWWVWKSIECVTGHHNQNPHVCTFGFKIMLGLKLLAFQVNAFFALSFHLSFSPLASCGSSCWGWPANCCPWNRGVPPSRRSSPDHSLRTGAQATLMPTDHCCTRIRKSWEFLHKENYTVTIQSFNFWWTILKIYCVFKKETIYSM